MLRTLGGTRSRRTTGRDGKGKTGGEGESPMGRHHTGCGRNRSMASFSGLMVETSGSLRRTGDRRSYFGGRERCAGGGAGVDRVFQPSNGESHRFQSPVNSERFR